MPPPAPASTAAAGWEDFYHPASGAVILGVDLLAFGGELATGFLDTLLVSVAAFGITLAAVWRIERKWGRGRPERAFWKALLGAVLAGFPLPITGTLFGTAILFLSGLHRLKIAAALKALDGVRRLKR